MSANDPKRTLPSSPRRFSGAAFLPVYKKYGELSQSAGVSFGFRRDGQHLVNSPPVQIHDLKPPAFIVEMLPHLGQVTELPEHEARDGVEVSLRRSRPKIEPIERVVSRHHAVDKERSILTFDYIRLFTLNVGQVPRNGLEQVGLGDNSFQASVFVDDRCQANRCLLELLQNLENPHRLVNHEGLADDGPCIQRLPMENLIEQVLLQD